MSVRESVSSKDQIPSKNHIYWEEAINLHMRTYFSFLKTFASLLLGMVYFIIFSSLIDTWLQPGGRNNPSVTGVE